MYCKYCGSFNADGETICQSCSRPLEAVPPVTVKSIGNYGMGWHKFLVNFLLFAGAVVNLIYAVQALTGAQYGENAAAVYLYYSGLQTVDVLYGLGLAAYAAYMIYTRFQLARFRVGAPRKLIAMYICGLALSAVYLIAASLITGVNVFDASFGSSIVSTIIMIAINAKYYRNRSELFVN